MTNPSGSRSHGPESDELYRRPLTFGSLFAGIGGFDLGFERAGMVCKWQVEIDPFCQKVLAKHWPNVRRHDDVRTFPPGAADDWRVDVICGGFPCQDISNAGKRAGISGAKSGLWHEFARIIGEVRPDYIVVENVAALLGRGIDRVLGDLAERGYDAEWDCLPAAAFGALHIRNRLFLLAYPEGNCGQLRKAATKRQGGLASGGTEDVDNAISRRYGAQKKTVFAGRGSIELPDRWAVEPAVGRVAYGIPARVDRLRGLGNAVVPQIAQWIGERIMEAVA